MEKIKGNQENLPYTLERMTELLGQKHIFTTCECGAPLQNSDEQRYCDDCLDLYADRADTEARIAKTEVEREGER